MKVVLVHGAATTAAVWSRLDLHGLEVLAPERPCTGDLDLEVEHLRPLCEGAFVVGVGGGATLGLALLAAGARLAGALLHEPAAGSLVPGLLDGVAAAYAREGVPGFARELYGPSWQPSMAPLDLSAVERDLTMFRAFEPGAFTADNVTTSVGELSPPIRHQVGRVLTERLGVPCLTLPGARHAVHLDAPQVLTATIRQLVQRPPGP